MNPSSEAILQLAWTQFWQVTLVILAVYLLVRLFCRKRPHLAYVLWLVVLVKCLTPPLVSSPTSVFSWAARPAATAASESVTSELQTSGAPAIELAGRPAAPPVGETTGRDSGATTGPIAQSPVRADRAVPAATPPRLANRAGSPTPWSAATIAAILGIVWLVGATVYAGYAVLSVIACRWMIRRRSVSVDPRLETLADAMCRQLAIGRRPRLAVVDAHLGPLSFGWLRATIVLPHALVSTKSLDELEPILAHELAHVRRRDGLVGLVQVAAQSLWWFHPLVWLANRQICIERERSCDEEVVAGLGYEPRRYGDSLLGVVELKQRLRLPAAVPGIRPFEVTRRRLEHLVKYSQHFRKRMPRRYWLVLLLGLFLVVPGAAMSRMEPRGTAAPPRKPAANPSAESEGWTVTGRVVDHRGAPVADAEVLLLGDERIIVDADRRDWFAMRTEGGRAPKPPSTRTDGKGKFKLARTDGAPNRIAVIAPDPLFWMVKRDKIADSRNVEIKLPRSGSLAVECDLPGKPAKQEVNIELRTFDGVDWNVDMLRFHFGSFALKNPGVTVFEHMPPAWYAVQRMEMTTTGKQQQLMTPADRRLVKVESARRATASIDRKVGRPLVGRVRGLENIDLRQAHVTIHGSGPEEEPGKNGNRVRRLTAFEVIPISSEGKFRTDPIPPGEYMAMLWAVRATTPDESPQEADFTGQAHFTVPEEGELPTVELRAKPARKRDGAQNRREDTPSLRVVDDEGNPVPIFETKVWTSGHGSSTWYRGGQGRLPIEGPLQGYKDAEAVDLTVRADGFASTIQRFAGAEREKLLRGEATIVLDRGQEVTLRFRLPDGMIWPEGLVPEVYFEDVKKQVQIMWQPVNRRNYNGNLPDFNMLNVGAGKEATATLRLAPETPPFRVAIYAPGFLQMFDRGPFTLADAKDGELEIDVEAPATLDVTFDAGGHDVETLPYESAVISVMWQLPGTGNAYITIASDEGTGTAQQLQLADLAAGDYRVMVGTRPKPGVENLKTDQLFPVNPGVFRASKRVSLTAGQRERVELHYKPYDAEGFRGDRTAVLKITKPDGSPAAGKSVSVTYFDEHYSLDVFSGKVPPSGKIVLGDITARSPEGIDLKPYAVRAGRDYLGGFGFDSDAATQEFTFRVPAVAGDMAPDVEMVSVADGAKTKLSSLRGKVVLLEFWATWCGPCQEPMEKLNHLAAEKRDAWKDRVAIVALSIDETQEIVAQNVAARGLNQLVHCWSGGEQDAGFQSPAARAFVVGGVPTSLVIDRDGRILWRGHPADNTDGKDLAGRVEAALAE